MPLTGVSFASKTRLDAAASRPDRSLAAFRRALCACWLRSLHWGAAPWKKPPMGFPAASKFRRAGGKHEDCWSCFAAQSRLAEPSRRRAGRSSPWTSCQNLSPQSVRLHAVPPGHFDMVWASPVCAECSQALTMRPRRLEEGDALVVRALEIMAHFDPLMWVIENPATGLLKTRPSWSACPGWTLPTASTGLRTGSRQGCGPMRWRPSQGLRRSGCRCMRGNTGGI